MLSPFLQTLIMAMTPVVELRAAITFGLALGLDPLTCYIAAVIGNCIPIPFIILFIEHVFLWMRKMSPKFAAIVDKLEKRAEEKSDVVEKYALWGLVILVAIPLPGTGAWTGSLAAAFMDMRLKKALPAVILGVLTAGGIMLALTHVGINLFSGAIS